MFRKLIDRLQDYFGISRKEARGALVLIIICFFVIWTPFIYRRWILPLVPPPSPPIDLKMLDSIAVELEKENDFKLTTPKRYSKKNFENIPKRPVSYFTFDPNVSSVDSLTLLGIPPFLAKRIDKFRSKGGRFRKKEDLLNIYDFPGELFSKLEKYIVLRNAAGRPNAAFSVKNNSSVEITNREKYTKSEKPSTLSFDINTVDTTELVKLRGIGSKLSVRILKFRDGLGGFHSENQYVEIFGLDSLALLELHKYAKVLSEVKKISINSVTAAELGKHPYFRDRKLISIIINYRDQHGRYENMEDLKKTKVVDDAFLKKVEPYLTF